MATKYTILRILSKKLILIFLMRPLNRWDFHRSMDRLSNKYSHITTLVSSSLGIELLFIRLRNQRMPINLMLTLKVFGRQKSVVRWKRENSMNAVLSILTPTFLPLIHPPKLIKRSWNSMTRSRCWYMKGLKMRSLWWITK